MSEVSGEDYDIADLLLRGICPTCLTPVSEKEPEEGITNGMHNYCLLQGSAGHVVGACWCSKDMNGKSLREIAVIAHERFRAEYGETP